MKITKQKNLTSRWGYYNWTNQTLVGFIKNPTFLLSIYLGRTWYHISYKV